MYLVLTNGSGTISLAHRLRQTLWVESNLEQIHPPVEVWTGCPPGHPDLGDYVALADTLSLLDQDPAEMDKGR